MIVKKIISWCLCGFSVNACTPLQVENVADYAVVKYEVIDIGSCSLVRNIKGVAHINSKGIIEKIDVKNFNFLQNGDVIFLDKESFLIIESNGENILLHSGDKASKFLMKISHENFKDCPKT